MQSSLNGQADFVLAVRDFYPHSCYWLRLTRKKRFAVHPKSFGACSSLAPPLKRLLNGDVTIIGPFLEERCGSLPSNEAATIL